MIDILGIGSFQFDNLIKNKVMFALVHTPFEWSQLYNVVESLHVKNCSMLVDGDAGLMVESVRAQKIPADYPIVLVCDSGAESKKAAEALENFGYINVYFVQEGFQGLLRDRNLV